MEVVVFPRAFAYVWQMSVQVKICGLRTPETVDVAVAAGAAYVGFMFYAPSPRFVRLADAVCLSARLLGHVRSVAVTVDADDDLLEALFKELKPDLVQMHGAEPPARVAEVRRRFGCPVIKAVSIEHPADFDALKACSADYFLFDARPRPDDLPGGLGRTFDWALMSHYHGATPWFLAGGLTPDTVARAIEETGARAVDVSSGVERESGVKDPQLIEAFIRNAAGAARPAPSTGKQQPVL